MRMMSAVKMPEKWLQPVPQLVSDMPVGMTAWIHWVNLWIAPDTRVYVDPSTKLEIPNAAFHVTVERTESGFIVTINKDENWRFPTKSSVHKGAIPVIELRERSWDRKHQKWADDSGA